MSWGLVAVAGATVVGGALASQSAGEAADVQAQAAEGSVAEQRRQFNVAQKQIQPFQKAGVSALRRQQALLGMSGGPAQREAYSKLAASPGQQFLQERAQKNLLRNAASIGGLGGGNVREALVQQGVGFAQQDLENQFGRLGQLAGQGQAATTNIGQLGQATSANIGQTMLASGQARASGIQQQNQALQGTIGGLANVYGQFLNRPNQ